MNEPKKNQITLIIDFLIEARRLGYNNRVVYDFLLTFGFRIITVDSIRPRGPKHFLRVGNLVQDCLANGIYQKNLLHYYVYIGGLNWGKTTKYIYMIKEVDNER